MAVEFFKYALVLSYVTLVYYLSWVGMRRTKDIEGFAIGNKDMNPWMVGIMLSILFAALCLTFQRLLNILKLKFNDC